MDNNSEQGGSEVFAVGSDIQRFSQITGLEYEKESQIRLETGYVDKLRADKSVGS